MIFIYHSLTVNGGTCGTKNLKMFSNVHISSGDMPNFSNTVHFKYHKKASSCWWLFIHWKFRKINFTHHLLHFYQDRHARYRICNLICEECICIFIVLKFYEIYFETDFNFFLCYTRKWFMKTRGKIYNSRN